MKLRVGYVLLLALFLLLLTWIYFLSYRTSEIHSKNELQSQEDGTNISPKRLLYLAPSYNLNQFDSLRESLGALVQLCDEGWNISIYLQVPSITNESSALFTSLKNSLHCSKMNGRIPLVLESFGDIGFGLNSRHRITVKRMLDDYDYFVYAEEDMILTRDVFFTFLKSEQLIRRLFPLEWIRYTPGLLRFELDPFSREPITWEFSPDKILVAKEKGEYFVVTVNLNQAIFIFSREQLLYLEDKCEYLSKFGNTIFYQELRRAMNKDWKGIAVGVSEWSSSFQHVLQCGVRRVIPVRFLSTSFIRHHTNKGARRRSAKDHIRVKDWPALVQRIIVAGNVSSSVDALYQHQVLRQYNLHHLARQKLTGRIKFVFHTVSQGDE